MNRIHQIFFSPTGTTRAIVDAVSKGLSFDVKATHDLTHVDCPETTVIRDGVAVIGFPVYAGRVPEDCLKRLASFSAEGIPTVLIAMYGNRAFEDALVELRDVMSEKGFRVVAAGAFVGEHSYSTPECPVAVGRPDVQDLEIARDLGEKVAGRLSRGDLTTPAIAGNSPYRERTQFGGIAPTTDPEVCTLCGQCVSACPVKVVSMADSIQTDNQGCIMCCACTRACYFGARTFNHPVLEEKRSLLLKNCSEPKAPQLFF